MLFHLVQCQKPFLAVFSATLFADVPSVLRCISSPVLTAGTTPRFHVSSQASLQIGTVVAVEALERTLLVVDEPREEHTVIWKV